MVMRVCEPVCAFGSFIIDPFWHTEKAFFYARRRCARERARAHKDAKAVRKTCALLCMCVSVCACWKSLPALPLRVRFFCFAGVILLVCMHLHDRTQKGSSSGARRAKVHS